MKNFSFLFAGVFALAVTACDLQPKIVSLPDTVGEFISSRYPALLADPETQPEIEEKDETPKTGVENYLGLAILVIIFSSTVMISMKKKNIKG